MKKALKVLAIVLVFAMLLSPVTSMAAIEDDFLITAFWLPPDNLTNATQFDYLRDANFNVVEANHNGSYSQAWNNTVLDLSLARGMKVMARTSNFRAFMVKQMRKLMPWWHDTKIIQPMQGFM